MTDQIKVSLITSCYRGLKYLADFFDNVLQQTMLQDLELIFIHNDPLAEEVQLVKEFEERHPRKISYVPVNELEPLAASWNRGAKMARGEYLTIWNVDDLRPPDSIAALAQALDDNADCVLSYGDYLIVPEYGEKLGILNKTPKYSRRYFSRSFPQGGAFYMWRKSIMEKLGYFDEQLVIVSDFDFSLRIASSNLKMCRVDSMIGYFTDTGQGISTNTQSKELFEFEKDLLYRRYAIFDRIGDIKNPGQDDYRVQSVLNFNSWQRIDAFLPDYAGLIRGRSYLKVVGVVRKVVVKWMRRLGILEFVHRFQSTILNRDI